MTVTLRRLRESDFELIERWYASPHMQPHFIFPGSRFTATDIREKFEVRLSADSDVKVFIAEIERKSYGFIQGYLHQYHPEISTLMDLKDGVLIDYFVGEASLLGKGLGAAMLRVFQSDALPLWFPDQSKIALYHDVVNVPARRCSSAAGFLEFGRFELKGSDQVAMIWHRPSGADT